MQKIEVVSPNTYKLKVRGHDMCLERTGDGGWRMTTHNASSRAYSGGMGGVRYFGTLQDVEAAYKSWLGIWEIASEQLAQDAIYRAKHRCHAQHYPGAQWRVFRGKQ